jgi:hypothetical protein
MSAYTASARIGRVPPRLATREDAADRAPEWSSPPVDIAPILADPAGRPLDPEPTLAERRAAIRERWAQLTFYLFDPNGWR